jgi:WD40 repeat protein
VATAGNDRSVKLWNPDTGRRTKTLLSHTGRALCLAFSSDGKTLASGGKEGVICLWNINEPSHKDQKDEPKSDKERKEEERRKKEQEKKKKNPPKP